MESPRFENQSDAEDYIKELEKNKAENEPVDSNAI